jgi:PEP-CTERM motif-containing protein
MLKLVLGVVGAAALSAASAANATLIITTPTSVSVSGPSTVNSVDFTFGYSDSDTNSPFTETVSWMNDLAGLYGLTLTTIAAAINGPTDVDISAAFVTGTGISGSINLLPALGNNDLVEQYFLAGLNLDSGTYTLTVEGTRGETGSFGGNVAFQQSGVPEPATWGLMLLGFGAVGWQLRRRRTTTLTQLS